MEILLVVILISLLILVANAGIIIPVIELILTSIRRSNKIVIFFIIVCLSGLLIPPYGLTIQNIFLAICLVINMIMAIYHDKFTW